MSAPRLTPAQRYNRAVRDMESAALYLISFVEGYSAAADVSKNLDYHRAKRAELLEHARSYGAAVRRVARLAI